MTDLRESQRRELTDKVRQIQKTANPNLEYWLQLWEISDKYSSEIGDLAEQIQQAGNMEMLREWSGQILPLAQSAAEIALIAAVKALKLAQESGE